MKKAMVICGPTASNKTALAVSLAKKLNIDVISADSMYIYKNLNIGTAKPSLEEMQGVKHHMIDVCSPQSTFSVGDYKEFAKPIFDKIISENKIPLICGGTGFYINSLLYDLSYGKSKANLEVRDKYLKLAEKFGNEYVYNILVDKDFASSEKIHPNDIKRVVRALEIFESGIQKSQLNDNLTPSVDFIAFCIDYSREVLYDRINKRVDVMFGNGLVQEIESLINMGFSLDSQCFQGIGYKEVVEYLQGKISLNDCVELVKLNTRHYAKRQITFFKKMPNLVYLQPDTIENLTDRILDIYDK